MFNHDMDARARLFHIVRSFASKDMEVSDVDHGKCCCKDMGGK